MWYSCIRESTCGSLYTVLTYIFMEKLKFIACIVLCEAAGLIGSLFTFPSIATWYSTIAKPSFTPPSFIFGPVWTTLFFLMGIALYHVLTVKKTDKQTQHNRKIALYLFGIQLVLNVLWSILFFGIHNLFAAFIEIIFLWIAILATIVAFVMVSRRAAFLLVPYIVWVSFAAFLTYSIWFLNL